MKTKAKIKVSPAKPARPRAATPAPPRRVPAKWRWHFSVLLELRDRLLRERGSLLRAAAEPLEPHSMDEADSATDEFDHDRALTELSAEQDALYEVDAALQRILDGSYGVCTETGSRIPAVRLKAVPWTRFTRKTEARLEGKGLVSRARLGTLRSVRGAAQVNIEGNEPQDETTPAGAEEEAIHVIDGGEAPKRTRKLPRKRSVPRRKR